jgi:hypothetical protein
VVLLVEWECQNVVGFVDNMHLQLSQLLIRLVTIDYFISFSKCSKGIYLMYLYIKFMFGGIC